MVIHDQSFFKLSIKSLSLTLMRLCIVIYDLWINSFILVDKIVIYAASELRSLLAFMSLVSFYLFFFCPLSFSFLNLVFEVKRESGVWVWVRLVCQGSFGIANQVVYRIDVHSHKFSYRCWQKCGNCAASGPARSCLSCFCFLWLLFSLSFKFLT